MNELNLIADAITIRFAEAGITDNADLMRCHLFGCAVALLADRDACTVDSAFELREYVGLPTMVDPVTMQEFVDKANTIMSWRQK